MTKQNHTSGAADQPDATVSLTTLADRQLLLAREASSGRSAQSLHLGGPVLRQTLLALLAGQELAEHESPGEALLQVISGQVRLTTTAGDVVEAGVGDQLAIPPLRHDLAALDDSVVLLTVVRAR